MIKESRKKLLILAVFIVVLMISMIVLSYDRIISSHEIKKEVKDVISNNNSSVVHYNQNIYFIHNNQLLTLPINFSKNNQIEPVVLIDFGKTSPGKNMRIYQNKIYYYYVGNTYIYDINDKSSKLFCSGLLQYINPQTHMYITLYDGYLYRAIYYSSTFATKKINKLLEAKVTFQYEDKDNLYYYVPDITGLMIGVRKSDFNILYYDSINTHHSNFKKAFSTNDYIFEIIEQESKQQLIKIDKKNDKKTIYPLQETYESISYEMADKEKNDFYLYCYHSGEIERKYVYRNKENQLKVVDGVLNTEHIENYSVSINGNTITLLKNDKEVTSIPFSGEQSDAIRLANIQVIDGYLYFDISLNKIGNNGILVRTSQNGGEAYILSKK